MTWPQVEYLGTRAREHQDVYFNMWRLRWFAHALATAPPHIFDGNIFYPEPRTLTYSDAMIVEGLVGAPLLWAGVPPDARAQPPAARRHRRVRRSACSCWCGC